MIGPHEGRELDLMLQGVKPLAAFSDIIPSNSEPIAEEIIPEARFAVYVSNRKIIRVSKDIQTQDGETLRIVCFTQPQEAWRAHSYIFLREQIHSKAISYTDDMDVIFGTLLGYPKADIDGFIKTL